MKNYRTSKAAAMRFAELASRLPGSVRGIDYSQASRITGSGQTSSNAVQQMQLEALEEFAELKRVFLNAMKRVGARNFELWARVNVREDTVAGVAADIGVSRSHAYRILPRVSRAVVDSLIERELLPGYCGRDLLTDVEPAKRKRVEVYRAEAM